ncbi:hypothetical protein HPB50_017478 [Hyalomma asiaticum]|uniref:Uncharacterized protein n=1 Tax=Hyalomma asiaticum TaxID=266040 RepID=A0ACB7RUE7_HYAAI|nr:hypothetical protein HPB50_017478 [Hyalomma asiaticum]
MVLAAAASLPASQLARLAHSVMDASTLVVSLVVRSDAATAQVSSALQSHRDETREEIYKLPQEIVALSSRRQCSSGGRCFSTRRTPSASPQSQCWYHLFFGDGARKCTAPCTFQCRLQH